MLSKISSIKHIQNISFVKLLSVSNTTRQTHPYALLNTKENWFEMIYTLYVLF